MTVLAFLMVPVLLVPLIRPVHGAVAVSVDTADYVIWALFTADYGVRLALSADRMAFVRAHLFDLAVVMLPFLRPLRAVRALRGLRGLSGLRVLQASRLAAFVGTGLGHARGGTIHNYGDALWWAVVTVTSVGYGDKYPVTAAGRGVAVVLMITGIALFGVVTASIASYFVEQDQDRRVEARLGEVLAVLHRMEARLDAADRPGPPAPGPSAAPSPQLPASAVLGPASAVFGPASAVLGAGDAGQGLLGVAALAAGHEPVADEPEDRDHE
jgi:voltage-gated potassium channel